MMDRKGLQMAFTFVVFFALLVGTLLYVGILRVDFGITQANVRVIEVGENVQLPEIKSNDEKEAFNIYIEYLRQEKDKCGSDCQGYGGNMTLYQPPIADYQRACWCNISNRPWRAW